LILILVLLLILFLTLILILILMLLWIFALALWGPRQLRRTGARCTKWRREGSRRLRRLHRDVQSAQHAEDREPRP